MSPVLGFITIQLPPFSTLLLSTACCKYFSTIFWIFKSIVRVKSLPSSAAIYVSSVFGISSWLALFELTILPGVPDKTSSHLFSMPDKPWLSLPQEPRTWERTVPFG